MEGTRTYKLQIVQVSTHNNVQDIISFNPQISDYSHCGSPHVNCASSRRTCSVLLSHICVVLNAQSIWNMASTRMLISFTHYSSNVTLYFCDQRECWKHCYQSCYCCFRLWMQMSRCYTRWCCHWESTYDSVLFLKVFSFYFLIILSAVVFHNFSLIWTHCGISLLIYFSLYIWTQYILLWLSPYLCH